MIYADILALPHDAIIEQEIAIPRECFCGVGYRSSFDLKCAKCRKNREEIARHRSFLLQPPVLAPYEYGFQFIRDAPEEKAFYIKFYRWAVYYYLQNQPSNFLSRPIHYKPLLMSYLNTMANKESLSLWR